jgi:hypothetical protein
LTATLCNSLLLSATVTGNDNVTPPGVGKVAVTLLLRYVTH